MNHQEIRFQILYYLYNKHYSGELGQPQVVENIILQTDLKNIEKNIVYGDIVYLEQSTFIRGEYILGCAHPPWVTITSYGIDTVDNITNQIISNVSLERNYENVRNDIKTISKEPNTKKKIIGIWEYAKANPAFFSSIIEKVLRITLGGGGLGGT